MCKYQYQFSEETNLEDVEATLLLARLAVESLHGQAQTDLDASHVLEPARRCLWIDASTPVGADLNRIFAGYLRREFGAGRFVVRRISREPVGNAGIYCN